MTPTSNSNPQAQTIDQSPESEFNLYEYTEVFWRRKLVFVAVFFIVLGLAAIYTLSQRKVYESTTQVVVAGKTSMTGDTLLDNLSALTQSQGVLTQVEILNSTSLLRDAFQQLTEDEQRKGFDPQTPGSPPKWAFVIDAAKDTMVINITAKSYDPKLAAKFATAIANTYLKRDLEQTNKTTTQALNYVEKELNNQTDNLRTVAQQLASFQKNTNLVMPEVQIQNAAAEIASLKSGLETAETNLQGAIVKENSLRTELRKIDPEIEAGRTIAENPEFSKVRAHLNELQEQLAAASKEYTPNSTQVRSLQEQVTDYKQRLNTVARTLVTAVSKARNPLLTDILPEYARSTVDRVVAEDRVNRTRTALDARETKFKLYPNQSRDFLELKRQVDLQSEVVKTLTQRRYELMIATKANIPSGVIASDAVIPLRPSYPRVTLNMLAAALLAVALAVGSVLLVERLDTRIHDPSTATRVAGFTLLSAIPDMKRGDLEGQIMIGKLESDHAFLEAFRLLRNNIAFSSPDKVLKTIAVTSASKSEGKTTISTNLAIAMAMDGKRVLIIDADLRRPAVHAALGLSRDIGFTTVVNGIHSLGEAVQNTEHENLYALASGPLPPNPTEFLNSDKARALFTTTSETYDVVIIDSPPSSGLSDFQVISTVADGAILVVAIDSTRKQQLQMAVRMLRQANAPMLGTVLNRVKYHRNAYYGYYSSYYYAYQGYYGEDEPQKGRKKKRAKSGKSA
jgi:capsular exopolysaccharide synthesis family protein